MYLYVIICSLVLCPLCTSSTDFVSEFVKKYKYPIEVHADVHTKDGYILTMQRIPYGINNTKKTPGPPILLVHSILDSGDIFVLLEPGRSLGYLLADDGYDVWIMNARSTSYSHKHETLDPDRDRDYWNFTMTELLYDVSGSIDYILDKTGQEKLFVLGISEGAALCFILCSEFPEYNKKIELLIALAPAVYVRNPSNPLIIAMVSNMATIKTTSEAMGMYELHPGRNLFRTFGPLLCSLEMFETLCKIFVHSIAGSSPNQLDAKYLPNIVRNTPEGVGLYQLLHYLQLHKTDNFQKYDYGSEETNLMTYGVPRPPLFDLSRVVVPTAIYYSEKDSFVNMKGVLKLSKLLPNVVDLYMVKDKDFSHTDFVIAKDAVSLLYTRVIDLMDTYRMQQLDVDSIRVNN